MGCRTCGGGNPAVPFYRNGMPTIWAFGPFSGYEVVEESELEDYLSGISPDVD